MKKVFIIGMLGAFFAPCFAAGKSIAIAIEMQSPVRMQLALEDLQIHDEKINGTGYMNQLADSWCDDAAWWKQVVVCGAGLVLASRAVLAEASLKCIYNQNVEAQLQHKSILMGKESYLGYMGSITGHMLVSIGIFVGWYALCARSTHTHVVLARQLIMSEKITIDHNQLTARARELLKRV